MNTIYDQADVERQVYNNNILFDQMKLLTSSNHISNSKME